MTSVLKENCERRSLFRQKKFTVVKTVIKNTVIEKRHENDLEQKKDS